MLPIESVDLREWGPRLRYCTTSAILDTFYAEVRQRLPEVLVYGSGDFHHLAALWLRRVERPVTVISFDNHPDWDIRPPAWSCGAWVNRALEEPHVQRVAVWGCGNFELEWPGRLFANRAALRDGRLEVFAWAERSSQAVRRRFECITRERWRERFREFATTLAGRDIYITVDLDCLASDSAVTNWEPGLFTPQDVAWAVEELASAGRLAGADVCGAWSPQKYARPMQRLAGWMDHPTITAPDPAHARRINHKALDILLPALKSACGIAPGL